MPTQQCPLDLPFAFDEGKQCCRNDEDDEGNQIHYFSPSCKHNLQVACAAERCISNGEDLEYSNSYPLIFYMPILR